MDYNKLNLELKRSVNKIIIHCSATRPSQDVDAEEIALWHVARGFKEIGYHFVIKRDATIELGRNINTIGAHTKNHNNDTIGICLIGGVSENNIKIPEDNFTEEQYLALTELLINLKLFTNVNKKVGIFGHYKFASKACPSFNVEKYLIKNKL